MPFRRIDLLGKIDATQWSNTPLPKQTAHVVQVLAGAAGKIPTDAPMRAVVHRNPNGTFTVKLHGETLIIKGLPAALDGKQVTFMIQSAAGGKGGELVWLAAKDAPLSQIEQQAEHQRGQSTRHKQAAHPLPQGKPLSATVEQVSGTTMRLAIRLPQPAGQQARSERPILQQLETKAIPGLKAGQQIQIKLHSVEGEPTIELLTNTPAADNVAASRQISKPAQFRLAKGEIATAVVQKRLPDGRVLLHLQGRTITSPAPVRVQVGDMLVLRMQQPPSSFQLVEIAPRAGDKAASILSTQIGSSATPLHHTISALRQATPQSHNLPGTAQQSLANLEQLLQSWASSSDTPIHGEQLAAMIRDAGGGLEAKLLRLLQQSQQQPALQHDLKAILLQLSKLADSQQSDIIRHLGELSRQAGARIESHQALNFLASMQGEAQHFELPMLVNQQLINVLISIEQRPPFEHSSTPDEHASNAPETGFNILFSLDLSALGKIRVDANISTHAVHARIHNEQQQSHQFIQRHLSRLEQRLHRLGFEQVYLISTDTPPQGAQQEKFEQLTTMRPANLGLLDIRI